MNFRRDSMSKLKRYWSYRQQRVIKWNSCKKVSLILKLVGKKINVWSNIMKKLNEYVTKGNNVIVGFNDKVSAVMTKMVGFEEQMKAIASLDTLVVCILSLVLVKILKDEFMDEGYQPVGDSVRTQEISSSGVFG